MRISDWSSDVCSSDLRMADADPDSAKIVADVRARRFQPIVSRRAAAGLHLHAEGREVQLVVKGGDIARLQLEEAHGLAHRASAFVHIGGRLQQQDLVSAEAALARPARSEEHTSELQSLMR